MPDQVRPPLVLDSPEFTARAENFANLMSVSDFQQRFFRDPSGTAAAEFGLSLETTLLNRANQLTYALLADPAFNTWAEDFQNRVNAALPSDTGSVSELKASKDRFVEEFVTSIRAHLAPETVASLERLDPGLLVAEDDIAILLLVFIAVVVVVALGVARPDEALSRKTVQLVMRQLNDQQIAQILAARAALGG